MSLQGLKREHLRFSTRYFPFSFKPIYQIRSISLCSIEEMSLQGFEPWTPAVSEQCSTRLSYRLIASEPAKILFISCSGGLNGFP